MADNDEWLNGAKARLATKEPRRRRPNSVAAKVEALRPDIQAARAAGKGWLQIAANISDGEPLNADAVRVAFSRSNKDAVVSQATSPTASRITSRSVSESEPEPKPKPKPINPACEPASIKPTPGPTTASSTSELIPIEVPNKPNSEEDTFLEMFGPMFDARDTRGRDRQDGSSEEAQS